MHAVSLLAAGVLQCTSPSSISAFKFSGNVLSSSPLNHRGSSGNQKSTTELVSYVIIKNVPRSSKVLLYVSNVMRLGVFNEIDYNSSFPKWEQLLQTLWNTV